MLAGRPGMPPLGAREDSARPRSSSSSLLRVIATDAAYTRIMVRAALDGFDVPQTTDAFPWSTLVRRSPSARHCPASDADVRVALLAAATLGWQVIGPLLLDVLDQQALTERELADTLRPALLAFLTADPAG